MTEIEFVGYSAVHPSDFIYDVPNGFTGYLLLLFDSPSELLIDGRLMRTSLLREAVSVNKHPISRNRSGILSSAF